MKRILLMSLTGALAMSFSSCREDLGTEMLNAVPLQVTATTGTDARAIHETTLLPAGSELGVSVFDGSGNAYEDRDDGAVNVPYRLQKVEGQDVWQADAPISLSATEGKAVAYYPYSASVTDIHAIPVDVTKSQTDFLYSGWVSGVSATSPQADFTLRHALCAVRVNITDGGYTGAGKVTSVSISSPALATVATLDAADGSFPSFSGQDTPVTSTEGFTIGQDPQSASLLAVPTGEAAGLSIRIAMDGKTFTVPFSSSPVTFLPGKVYTVNLTAKDGEAPFEVSGTVGISTDWSTVVLQNPTMDPEEIQVPDRYVIEIEIPTDNFSFYSNVGEFTGVIEWGDGKTESYSNASLPVHLYEKAGKYLVIAKGMCNKISWYSSNNSTNNLLTESKKCLTDIQYIGGGMGITSMYSAFRGCSNLKTLRKGIFDNLSKVTDFGGTFWGCSRLQNIPVGLFDNCTEVTRFWYTFYYCSSLQCIPDGLFDNCTEVTGFWYTFYYCRSLQCIPDGLFDSCTKVTSFESTFKQCSSLQCIPDGLFDSCTKVTSFESTFAYCKLLQNIPNRLFAACKSVENFRGTFYDCTSIKSVPGDIFASGKYFGDRGDLFDGCFSSCSSLESVGEGLFDNCPEAYDFSCVFFRCSSLKTVPRGLFAKCKSVWSFEKSFYECRNLEHVPSDMFGEKPKLINAQNIFYSCYLRELPKGVLDGFTKVQNFKGAFYGNSFSSIPDGLFDNCTQVTDFSETFMGGKALQSIPQGLFDSCTKVTSFSSTFYYCSSLQSIPDGLFDNCTEVKSFSSTFYGCSGLTSIPRIFKGSDNLTSFYRTFTNCEKLKKIDENLFDGCDNVSEFYETFYGCTALENIPAGLFDSCIRATNFYGMFMGCPNLRCESPYSVYDGIKIHLYEREKYPQYFTIPTKTSSCFFWCNRLTDYSQIPSSWK